MAELPEDDLRRLQEALNKLGSRTLSTLDAMKLFDARTRTAVSAMDREARAKNAQKQVIESATAELKELQKQASKGKMEFSELQQKTDALKKSVQNAEGVNYESKKVAIAAIDAGYKRAEVELRNEKIMSAFGQAASIASTATSGFIKGLQGARQDPFGSAVDIMKTELTAISSATQGIGGALTEAAPALNRVKKIGPALSMGATGIGTALTVGGKAIDKLKDVADPAISSLKELTEAYTNAASIGMTFAGGMGELRSIAGQMGVDFRDLSEGIGKNQDAFLKAGITSTQAAKLLGNFGRGLARGEEATDLMALGFVDVKDRVALAGNALQQARMEGVSLAEAQKNVAGLTVQYAKDLKFLQAIVGKDAEQAKERARAAQASTAIQSSLTAEQKKSYGGTVEALAQFQDASVRASLELALAQKAQGGIINDSAINNSKATMQLLEELSAIGKSGMSQAEASRESAKAIYRYSQAMDEEAKNASTLTAQAAKISVQSSDAAGDIVNKLRALSDAAIKPKMSLEEIDEAFKRNANKIEDETTKSVMGIAKTAQNTAADLQQVATTPVIVEALTGALKNAQKPLEDMVAKVKEVTEQLEKMRVASGGSTTQAAVSAMGGAKGIGETAGRTAAVMAGAAIGQAVIPIPVVGALIGGYIVEKIAGESFAQVGGAIGSAIGDALSSAPSSPSTPYEPPSMGMPMARGGIISGPASGYPATLHGREMVIPLPETARPEAISQAIGRGTMNGGETSEQMVTLMKNLNENFENMQSIMRSVADHTARTARGVA